MHLRVWWKVEESTGFMKSQEIEKTGIVVGSFGKFDCEFMVREDGGELVSVLAEDIDKSEWVNHPSNAD